MGYSQGAASASQHPKTLKRKPQHHHLFRLVTHLQMPCLKPSNTPTLLLAARASSQHPIFTPLLWQKPWKAPHYLSHLHHEGWHLRSCILWLNLSFHVYLPICPHINQTERLNISKHVPHFLPPLLMSLPPPELPRLHSSLCLLKSLFILQGPCHVTPFTKPSVKRPTFIHLSRTCIRIKGNTYILSLVAYNHKSHAFHTLLISLYF